MKDKNKTTVDKHAHTAHMNWQQVLAFGEAAAESNPNNQSQQINTPVFFVLPQFYFIYVII